MGHQRKFLKDLWKISSKTFRSQVLWSFHKQSNSTSLHFPPTICLCSAFSAACPTKSTVCEPRAVIIFPFTWKKSAIKFSYLRGTTPRLSLVCKMPLRWPKAIAGTYSRPLVIENLLTRTHVSIQIIYQRKPVTENLLVLTRLYDLASNWYKGLKKECWNS